MPADMTVLVLLTGLKDCSVEAGVSKICFLVEKRWGHRWRTRWSRSERTHALKAEQGLERVVVFQQREDPCVDGFGLFHRPSVTSSWRLPQPSG